VDGVRTGLSELDNMTGGFHAGELTILAARPSVGKSACALRIATSAAFQYGHSVLFFSLEMSSMEVADRVLSMDARVNLHHMRRGYTSSHQRQMLAESASTLAASRLFINDCGSQTPTQLAAEFRRFKRKNGVDLVVIDYLQYMASEYRRDENDEQRLGNAAKRLKYLARDFNVPVLCVAQLNRETEKGAVRAPRLSDIRGSGQIEQHADNVFFIHRQAYYNSSLQPHNPEEAETAEFIIAKQRNGPCGDFNLAWIRAYARFDNPASTMQEQQAASEFTGDVQPSGL
jgi:replicative DNA helicase